MTNKYETFRACDDLSPEDFKLFSAAYTNDFASMRSRLTEAHRKIEDAERSARFYGEELRRLRRDARRHGVELPE